MPKGDHRRQRKTPFSADESLGLPSSKEVASPLDEDSMWVYWTSRGDTWDAQPACWITDYVLGLQCFVSFGCLLYMTSITRQDMFWNAVYLAAMGSTATLGGVLHHVAYKAQSRFSTDAGLHRRRVFGLRMTQPSVDRWIRWMWRFVLGLTTLANFALVAAAASRYMNPHWSQWTIYIAGIAYTAVAAIAFATMRTSIMLVGFLPPLCFGSIGAVAAFERGWLCELLVLAFALAGGLIQAAEVSPSRQHFNHNALAHVCISASVTTMAVHLSVIA
ncbi:hypothetical protein H310_00641 [Aphanomyces invadans]|uniref:Transmembrane protein n=1 Tax=Aphanomyces invadans TaxID=157072 RepID=A0A024UUV1_9STRA|nr:hypothetical protein H310_00641 [Aphanomyces invadans]ETW10301.1 hypothetical protein H310_00641 [Aphanomyces invadans]|eukprot:XP_008861712.1 hypothetical protein H310_00641 [Aphanomyces invadans]